MNIGTVVEGPTDREVLNAIINRLIPGEHRYFPLQPTDTSDYIGKGWKGVRRWCRETHQRENSSLEIILSGKTGPELDLLVIQVDADISDESDLQEGNEIFIRQPCPPVKSTVIQLESVIKTWLRRDELPAKIILAIPAQDTEHWIFAALFPEDELCLREDYECFKPNKDMPAYRLSLKDYGKLTERKDGEIKKHLRRYREVVIKIADNWDTVCRICSQAQRLVQNIAYRLL